MARRKKFTVEHYDRFLRLIESCEYMDELSFIDDAINNISDLIPSSQYIALILAIKDKREELMEVTNA